MKKRLKLMLALVMSLVLLCGMSITTFAAEDISMAMLGVGVNPTYCNKKINASDFGIVVELDGLIVSDNNYDINFYSDEGCSNQVSDIINAGIYYVTATGKNGYGGTTTPARVMVKRACLPKPYAASGLVYDGTAKNGVEGANLSYMEISNGTNTEAGTYEATVTLIDHDNYCWAGEDGDPTNSNISQPIRITYVIRPDKGPAPKPTPKPTPAPTPAPTPDSDEVEKHVEEKEEDTPQVNEENLSINPVAIDKSLVTKGDEPIIPGNAYNFSSIKTIAGFSAQIKKSAANNTTAKRLEVYSSKPMCFNKDMISAINESGKTLVYYFTFEGHLYSVTVPAGTRASDVLNKGPMEGPLYIGKILGTTRLIK